MMDDTGCGLQWNPVTARGPSFGPEESADVDVPAVTQASKGGAPGLHVKSLSRSTVILRMLADRPMRPADLSRELDKPWATIYRTVRVLTDEGMLQRDPDSGDYSVGPTMWALATTYVRDHQVLGVGLGHLEQLIPNVPGIVKLTERCDGEAVTLFAEQNPHAPAVRKIREQYRLPLHCASFGYVLLANAPASVIDAYLARPLRRISDRTITNPTVLRSRLDEVREQGYAESRAELQTDNGSISVPILRKDATVVAALSAVLPLTLMEDEAVIEKQRGLLNDTAVTISESLGWRAYAQTSPTYTH